MLTSKAFIRGLAIALAATLAAMAIDSPAHAGDPWEPYNRCRAGGVSTDTTLTLPANPGSASALSGYIWQYDAVQVTATGLVRPGPWPYPENGPNGITDTAPSGGLWPLPGARKFSLVGAFAHGSSRWFLGASSNCFRWDGTANTALFLWVNDEWPHDSYGQFTVTIKHYYYFP